MKPRFYVLGVLALCASFLSACDSDKGEAGASEGATAAGKARLMGAWIEEEEFGGGDCKGLDCSAPLPEKRQQRLEFEDKTYSKSAPEAPETKGRWSVTGGKGDELQLELSIDGLNFPPSKKSVVFLDADRFEMRADNRHGGIYRRASD